VAEQGYERFPHKFVPFPRAEWVESVPTYFMNSALVVHKEGNEEDIVAARFAEYLNSATIQNALVVEKGMLSNRIDVAAYPDDPWTQQIAKIVNNNGIFDVGLTNEKFMATRAQHFPILQKVLNLQLTPAESIAAYEKALNEALSE
jgi:ABC-type glycerol-3-phosphate transport system substrate-binding protein